MADTVIAPDLRERYFHLASWLNNTADVSQPCPCGRKRELYLIERVSKAEQENVALRAKVARLEAAISWALGEAGSDFRGRRENEGPYWWRKEFRIRARGREGE